MTTAHTPGPWTFNRRGIQGVSNYTVIGTDSNFHTEIGRIYHGSRGVDGEANARLIAAAPELLVALKHALPEIGSTFGIEHSVVCEARAAIAKAEGR